MASCLNSNTGEDTVSMQNKKSDKVLGCNQVENFMVSRKLEKIRLTEVTHGTFMVDPKLSWACLLLHSNLWHSTLPNPMPSISCYPIPSPLIHCFQFYPTPSITSHSSHNCPFRQCILFLLHLVSSISPHNVFPNNSFILHSNPFKPISFHSILPYFTLPLWHTALHSRFLSAPPITVIELYFLIDDIIGLWVTICDAY